MAPLLLFNSNTLIFVVLQDLSQLLNTGLDKNQLKACVELIENGINAEAVAVSLAKPTEIAACLTLSSDGDTENCAKSARRSPQRRSSQGKGC